MSEIFRGSNNKIVAVLKAGVLEKKVDSRRHKLRIVDGYAVDLVVLREAYKKGAKSVRVLEEDTGKMLEVDILRFADKGVDIDFGHGKQKALARCYWREKNAEQGELFNKNKIGG